MVLGLLRFAAIAVLGFLGVYIGYLVASDKPIPFLSNMNDIAETEEVAQPEEDAAPQYAQAKAVTNGVPNGVEPISFEEGQRADRVAKTDDADAESFARQPDTGAVQLASNDQLRGIPQSRDETAAADVTAQNPAVSATTPTPSSVSTPRFTRARSTAAPATAENASMSGSDMSSRSPRRLDKADDGKFFTANASSMDKKDNGQFFVANPKMIDKKDDGRFFTDKGQASITDPCLNADGTPYFGPGTASNPYAPVNPCLPKATAESVGPCVNPDGSLYTGPGTARNPGAPGNPCLKQAEYLGPCVKADGSRYVGPGTAQDPLANTEVCMMKKVAEYNPCVYADGTPYVGPGTAQDPYADVSLCLPKATAESYADLGGLQAIEARQPGQLPSRPVFFAPDPSVGDDYRTVSNPETPKHKRAHKRTAFRSKI